MRIICSRFYFFLAVLFLFQSNLSLGQKAEPNRIVFSPGTTIGIVSGTLRGDEEAEFVFGSIRHQQMIINVEASPSVPLVPELKGPGGTRIDLSCQETGDGWVAILPESGDYLLGISKLNKDQIECKYNLKVSIPLPGKASHDEEGDHWPGKPMGKVLPVDEGLSDPGFKEVRDKILEAIKKRDYQYLLDNTSKSIVFGSGANQGIEAFKKFWKPESPDSELWKELEDALLLGGRFQDEGKAGKSFWAPYVFHNFPGETEETGMAVITGSDVPVRATPSSLSPVIATLSFEIVKLSQEEGQPIAETIDGKSYPWIGIILPDKKSGFVYGKFIRSPSGYRAVFDKIDGRWTLTYFCQDN